ncbi:MAG: nucleotidyltransferase domain-containing protein [Candidatus Methanofastidiosa archaeon]|jgi:predicted nucleotidyltransferase|nr:nucleotidyltransferase domain-containing protein [Candidatus Methanofastidiosa archaeon]
MKYYSINHENYLNQLFEKIKEYYGKRLTSLLVYGSYARQENKLDSDIDLFIVIKTDKNRRDRIREFVTEIESKLLDSSLLLLDENISSEISTVILTEKEALFFNPLYLDMVSKRIILFDRNDFMENLLLKYMILMRECNTKKEKCGSFEYYALNNKKILEGINFG